MCDVLPLKLCHILLGRTWLWDRDAQHAGRANTYSFIVGKKKYTLTCATDAQTLKLQKSSLLIQRAFPHDGILGIAPNSPESSSFQRRRIDDMAMEWLDKSHRLWKPKPKAMGSTSIEKSFWSKNKCQW